jgi:hypothetical protein
MSKPKLKPKRQNVPNEPTDDELMFLRAEVTRLLSDTVCDLMNTHGAYKSVRRVINECLRREAAAVRQMENY